MASFVFDNASIYLFIYLQDNDFPIEMSTSSFMLQQTNNLLYYVFV